MGMLEKIRRSSDSFTSRSIPEVLVEALLVTEARDFVSTMAYHHLRLVALWWSTLKKGARYKGSTLNQQLAKTSWFLAIAPCGASCAKPIWR